MVGEVAMAMKVWLGHSNMSTTADKAAEIIGYTKTTVISHIREKHISAVLISGKYIVHKSALVDFIVSDAAFEIVNKSPWHMNTILKFTKKKE